MKKLSLLLVAALTVASTLGYSKDVKPVIITGKVVNVTSETPRVIKFNFIDPFIDGSLSVEISDSGEFRVQQDMLYIHNMTVNYSKHFINLYVQPGDSVHLVIDASLINKPKFEWLTITGDNALIKSQLNLCAYYMYTLPTRELNMNLPPDAMLAAVKQNYDRYMLALNEYSQENNLDPVVIKWVKKDIKYIISNSILDYGHMKDGSLSDKESRINIFTDPFFDMYNPENFQSMLFPYHLDNYVSFLKRIDPSISDQTNTEAGIMKKIAALIGKLPAGECRDYMLYSQLKRFASKTPGILNSINDLNTRFTTAIYYDQLKKTAEVITKPVFPTTKVSGIKYLTKSDTQLNIPKTDVFTYLAAKYPGKVLYIDVYATWCKPCLDELKYTPSLYKAMKDKDVVFVNLCLASSSANWQKLVKEKSIKGQNYFFADDATKLFMGNYKLQGYPSYILVNKQGQIVTTGAPRPSDKSELYNYIDKLLNDKILLN